ncbi:MAG: ribosomal L7Ae/L30e/S12e/Gadd45 family protein [Nanoarchaeota archaeon]|nr:ribosomal L7Ae/L30e/S12e/Gadd45 family protein [Nanoarchaeota archaeon]
MKELKEAVKEKKLIIGTDRTIKNLKMHKVKKVYISSNCKKDIEEDLQHYCNLYKIPLTKAKENNEELGVICKKPFSVSVLSF